MNGLPPISNGWNEKIVRSRSSFMKDDTKPYTERWLRSLTMSGNDARHVAPRRERHVAELLEADSEDALAGGHEALVAGDVAGGEPRDLGAHRVGIAGVAEGLAVGEADRVERRDRP